MSLEKPPSLGPDGPRLFPIPEEGRFRVEAQITISATVESFGRDHAAQAIIAVIRNMLADPEIRDHFGDQAVNLIDPRDELDVHFNSVKVHRAS